MRISLVSLISICSIVALQATVPLVHNFEQQVLKSSTPVIAKFSASWCGPCRKLAPEFAKAAQAYQGKVAFYELDADNAQHKSIFSRYNIMGLPTLIIFDKGKVVKRQTGGSLNASMIQNMIREATGVHC